jgi:hypothetical protein
MIKILRIAPSDIFTSCESEDLNLHISLQKKRKYYGTLPCLEINNAFIGNDCFPNELYYLILEYLTDAVEGLIKFKTICRSWKLIAETSPLWLSCSLEFYCPVHFIPNSSLHIYPCEDLQVAKLTFILQKQKKSVHNFTLGESIVYGKYFRVNIDKPEERIDTLSSVEPFNQLKRAKEIHDTFLPYFLNYNRKWSSYVKWRDFLLPAFNNVHSLLIRFVMFPSMVINTFLIYLSMYFFRGFSTSAKISSDQKMGFLCLYLFFSLYILDFLLGMLKMTIRNIFSSRELKLYFSWKTYLPDGLLLTFLTACLIALGMTQAKVTTHPEMLWTTITVPFWIMLVLLLGEMFVYSRYLEKDNSSETAIAIGFVGSFSLLILVPLTVIGYSYDHHQNSFYYLKYLSICLYPHALLMIILLVWLLQDNFYLWYNYIWLNKMTSREENRNPQMIDGGFNPVTPTIMKWRIFFNSVSLLNCIVCTGSLVLLLILPQAKEIYGSKFFLLKQPLELVLLVLSSFHLFLISLIIDFILEII